MIALTNLDNDINKNRAVNRPIYFFKVFLEDTFDGI